MVSADLWEIPSSNLNIFVSAYSVATCCELWELLCVSLRASKHWWSLKSSRIFVFWEFPRAGRNTRKSGKAIDHNSSSGHISPTDDKLDLRCYTILWQDEMSWAALSTGGGGQCDENWTWKRENKKIEQKFHWEERKYEKQFIFECASIILSAWTRRWWEWDVEKCFIYSLLSQLSLILIIVVEKRKSGNFPKNSLSSFLCVVSNFDNKSIWCWMINHVMDVDGKIARFSLFLCRLSVSSAHLTWVRETWSAKHLRHYVVDVKCVW